jgi:Tol biopolymer transport system component
VAASGRRRLAWFDRAGSELSSVENGETAGSFALSPDGRRAVIARTSTGNGDLWSLDLARGAASRLTSEVTVDTHPLFSADGTRLIYQQYFAERGAGDIYWRSLSAGGVPEVLVTDGRGKIPTDVSRDGRLLLFKVTGSKSNTWDIWALPLAGDRKPFSVLSTPADERDAVFSPDGRWMAYQSNESGRFEVYVQPFGRVGEKQQVSVGGGAQPRWRPDGRETFYIALDGRLTAVSVKLGQGDAPLELGRPEPLFVANVGPVVQPVARQMYVASADGQRFLMSTLVDAVTTSPIEVILNFDPASHR